MATLYDRQGKPIEVHESEVPKLLASGRYGLAGGQRLNLVTSTGEVFASDNPDDIIAASREGWFVESAEQQRSREVKEQYGSTLGQEVLAGLAGAGRGLTFGLSDVLLTKTGLAREETLSGLQEANPAASLGTELATIAGSLLIPGGQGRAVSLLRGAGAAPRAAARAGVAAERATARLLGPAAERGLLGRVAGRGVELGAGSALEGALYGGAQFISEAALGDIDATAENLLGHVGMGAVIGGGFGVGLGSGFQGMKELVTGTGKLTKKGADVLVDMWQRQTGNKAVPGLADAYASASEAAISRPGMVRRLIGKEERARAVQELSKRDDGARVMADLDNEIRDIYEEVHLATTGRQKKEFFRQIAKEGDENAAAVLADDLLGTGVPIVRDETGAIIQGGGLISELDEAVRLSAKTEGELGFRGHWKDLLAATKRTRKIIDKARGKADFTGRIHGALDDLKREIGNIRYRKMARIRDPRGHEIRALDKADELYKRIMNPLEDAGVWGERAAETQRRYNARWVTHLEDIKRRPDHRFHESFQTTDGKIKVQAKPQGFRAFIDDMGSLKNDLDEPWLFKQMDTRQELMDEALKLYDLPPDTIAGIGKARESLKKFKDLHDDMKKTVGLQNQLRELEEATRGTGFSTEMGVVGGAILGGPIGALAGGAIGAILNPARTIRQLTTLERIAGGYRQRIKNGLKRYVDRYKKVPKKGQKRLRRMIAPSSVGALMETSFNGGKRKSKNRQEAFKHRMEELRAFVAPEVGIKRLEDSTRTVSEVAPQVAGKIQAKAVAAANFLLEKAPKNPGAPSVFGAQWKPSEIELSKFERFVKAVSDPASVVKDIENGTLTHEAVETLRELYPRMYAEIIQEITTNLDELRETLPYEERIQLSVLFGIPVDPTMRPEFIAAMQEAQAHIRPSLEGLQAPPPTKAVQKVKPDRHMTRSQRLAAKA